MSKLQFKVFFKAALQPLLISVFFAFFLFSFNVGETYFSEFFAITVLTAFFVLFLLKITNFFFQDYTKSSIFLSVILIVFCFLSPILEAIKNSYGGYGFFRARYFLIPCSIFIVWIFFKFRRLSDSKNYNFLSTFLILPFLLLLVFSSIKIGIGKYKIYQLTNKFKESSNRFEKRCFENIDFASIGENLPNIYFIILDCYAARDLVLNFYNYDNTEFLNKLREKGFYIAEDCTSNYCCTFLSISATLNMAYHDHSLWKDSGTIVTGLADNMIKNNNAARLLKKVGYKYLLNPSHWGPTQTSHLADYSFREGYSGLIDKWISRATYLAGFTSTFLDNTLLAPLWVRFQDYKIRKIVLQQLENLKSTVNIEGPFFVFSHFVCPHGPYLFKADGSAAPRWRNDGIGDQTEFISKEIYKVIDYILEKSKAKPIIILQADHALGGYDWNTNRILNAYYTQDKKLKEALYQSISPINNFRLIFDRYLGCNLGLLSDDYYKWLKSDGFTKINK